MATAGVPLGDWACTACGVRFHHKNSLVRQYKTWIAAGDPLHVPVPQAQWAVQVSTTPAHLVPPVPARNKYTFAAPVSAGVLPLAAAPVPVAAVPPVVAAAPPPPPPPPPPHMPARAVAAPRRSTLRSSRTTRNQDHNLSARNRAGVIDHDPTDGLPVRRWVQEKVTINQDAQNELAETNDSSKQDETDYPWPELGLPTFFSQLAPVNQALIRRSRMGDRNVKPSVWDRETEQWIPHQQAEQKAKQQALKSKYLMNLDTEEQDDHEEDDSSDSNDDEDNTPPTHPNGGPAMKKRKITTAAGISDERIFEAKKWVSVPVDKADTIPEPKYLADRRPGMQNLYTSAYKSTNGYGMIGYGGDGTMYANAAGFDLGDGSGLGNALGGNNPGLAQDQGTPVRKNMPPKRKKKKLGGPGRKKANPNPETTAITTEGQSTNDVVMDGTVDNNAENGDGDKAEDAGDNDSEGEGSEEGEIEENNGPEGQVDVAAIENSTAPQPPPSPQNNPAVAASTTATNTTEISGEVSEPTEPEPQPAEQEPSAAEQSSPQPPVVAVAASPEENKEGGTVAAEAEEEKQEGEGEGEEGAREVDLLESLEASIDGQGQQQVAVGGDAMEAEKTVDV